MKDSSCRILINCQTTETDTTTTSATLTEVGWPEVFFFLSFGAVLMRHMKDCSCRILTNCQTTQTDTSTSSTLTKAGLKVSGFGRSFSLLSAFYPDGHHYHLCYQGWPDGNFGFGVFGRDVSSL